MKIITMKSSGDSTSVSFMSGDEINTFEQTHNRKDRPNWEIFLNNVGYKKFFVLEEIDLFAFSNNQKSFTATRSIATYLKGISTALIKPLMVIDDPDSELGSEDIAKLAKFEFQKCNCDASQFKPEDANPSYPQPINYKKTNE
ncbi:MAG: hypothetical protein CMD80_03875 [Gammaproteobacteria bacterium]|nr:hypothetical protein [Gammaproteobacteria bacterium]